MIQPQRMLINKMASLKNGTPLCWTECALNFTFTHNRVSTQRGTRNVPFQVWNNLTTQPDVSFLRAFWQPCFPHTMPSHQTSKLNPRASTCRFVGYDNHTSAYRVWDGQIGEVVLPAHVRFLKNIPWPTIQHSRFQEPNFPDAAAIRDPQDDDFLPSEDDNSKQFESLPENQPAAIQINTNKSNRPSNSDTRSRIDPANIIHGRRRAKHQSKTTNQYIQIGRAHV